MWSYTICTKMLTAKIQFKDEMNLHIFYYYMVRCKMDIVNGHNITVLSSPLWLGSAINSPTT